jgi:predicted amidophosphoribosyltransferase
MEQSVINIIIGTILSVLGWFARQLWDAVQVLKTDMQKIEISLPTHYVRKDELEARFDKLELMLDRISEKLDKKVDK